MLPGIAICVYQYVASFEANSKKLLIHFLLALSWPLGQPETAEKLQRNMSRKSEAKFLLLDKRLQKDQKGSSIKTHHRMT